jgi:4-hydroxybenzoate polyprenyltransferase/phosphoserine phosphatase
VKPPRVVVDGLTLPEHDASDRVPLVVDLDGTLLRTDSLWEGLVALLKRRPWHALRAPFWIPGGKAAFKSKVAEQISLDVSNLPYDTALYTRLRQLHGVQPLILCTGADSRFAHAIALHLGLFDSVIATHDGVNLTGLAKAKALVSRFGDRGYDYVGNDLPDVAVFANARHAWVVNPTPSLRRRLGELANLELVIEAAPDSRFASYLRALRPVQWVKNLLVFVPLLATLESATASAFARSFGVFFAFGLVASSVYVLNDLLDLSADRQHPRKRRRPWAAGLLPLQHAFALIALLLSSGVALAWLVSPLVAALLAFYWLCTNLYSFWLKRVPLLDTLVLAGLYTIRILTGAAAIGVVPSVWLLSFSMFFFLSLALAKRHAELLESGDGTTERAIPGRGYRPEDLTVLVSQGSASGYAAVLVLALYIDSGGVREHYRHPEVIWLICPLVLYWINKLWLNSQRREISDDPVIWALTNRVSRAIAVLSLGLLLVARFLP